MKIEFDSGDQTITVDRVKISLEMLQLLANPDDAVFYKIARDGNRVTLRGFQMNVDSLLAQSHNAAQFQA